MPPVNTSPALTPVPTQTLRTAVVCSEEGTRELQGSLTTLKAVVWPPNSSPTLGARMACWYWPRKAASRVMRQSAPAE